MMIPGMYDAHCHPMIYAFLSTGIILKATMTKQDVIDEIAKYIQEHPDNECYFGQGYPEWVFDESGPKKTLLDSICSDKPVFISPPRILLLPSGRTGRTHGYHRGDSRRRDHHRRPPLVRYGERHEELPGDV